MVENEEFEKTEVGLIPSDWEIKELGVLGEVIIGLTYSPEDVSKYGTLVLRSSNIQDNKLAYKNNVYVTKELPERVFVKENDLLICVRNGSRNLIGKSALINKSAVGSAFGAFMSIYRSELNYYISKLFQSTIIQKQIENNLGATINQITNKDLKSFWVPLPPTKTEQTAIATTLSDMDELIAQTEKLIKKKKAIKQGVMQELLRPKEGWVTKKLENIAKFQKGKGLPKSQINEYGKFKCIHYGELFTKYKETITKILSYTDENDNCFYSLINDVLMPTSDVTPNGLATASCLKEDGIILGGDVLVIRITPNILDGIFLSYYISQNKEKIMKLVSGSTVYHLYGSDMKDFEVSFPDITTQLEIIRVISDLDSELNILEMKFTKLNHQKQGMMQSLLTGKIRLV
jgi:type I restriction enzyme S subunit